MELPVWNIQHQSRLRGTPHAPTPHQGRKGAEAQPSLARLGRTGAFVWCAQAGLGVGHRGVIWKATRIKNLLFGVESNCV